MVLEVIIKGAVQDNIVWHFKYLVIYIVAQVGLANTYKVGFKAYFTYMELYRHEETRVEPSPGVGSTRLGAQLEPRNSGLA
jgi:hypothetical protein